jgi:multiple sugar transport system permease protein
MLRRSLLAWSALLPLIGLSVFPFLTIADTILRGGRPGAAADFAAFWSGLWLRTELGTALLNSLSIALLTAAASTIVGFPAAYALSRHRFRGRRLVSELLLASQMFAPIMLVIGLAQMVSGLGLGDTRVALVALYTAFQVTFSVWMLRGYIDAIPVEIEEAARLDGASRLRVFATIVLPLSMPAIAVTATFAFITAWNEFALALTLLRSPTNFTLPLRVNALTAGRYAVDWRDVMGAVLIASLPVFLLFAGLQRYLMRGLRLSLGAS